MKRLVLSVVLVALIAPFAMCGRGGNAAIGGFAGSMVGSVIGNAISKDQGSSRDRDAAREARQETREMRKELDRRRYEENRRMRDKLHHTGTSPTVLFLVGLIIVLGVALVVLGFLIMKKRF